MGDPRAFEQVPRLGTYQIKHVEVTWGSRNPRTTCSSNPKSLQSFHQK